MKYHASKLFFVVVLILSNGLAPAASAGELTVTRQKDGTLLITNMDPPKEEAAIPEVKAGATVKEVQPPAVVSEVASAPRGDQEESGTAKDGDAEGNRDQ